MFTIAPPPYSEIDFEGHTCERIITLAEYKLASVFAQRNREPSLRYVLLLCALLTRLGDNSNPFDDPEFICLEVPDSDAAIELDLQKSPPL
jgi:hypothetical protein